jgi:hypothetical protein
MGLFGEFVEEMVELEVAEEVFDNVGRGRHHNNYGPSLGMDVRDGDLVENFGNGMGVDLDTGQLEFEIGNSGFDI